MIYSLSARLTKEFGPGSSERNLWLFKKFYQMYTGTIKVQTVSAEFKIKMPLSWSHYVFLMGINDDTVY